MGWAVMSRGSLTIAAMMAATTRPFGVVIDGRLQHHDGPAVDGDSLRSDSQTRTCLLVDADPRVVEGAHALGIASFGHSSGRATRACLPAASTSRLQVVQADWMPAAFVGRCQRRR